MAGYSASGLLDGDYGYNSFWDNMSVGDMYELTQAPQHGDAGLVSALRIREQQDKELERQVKKYGEEEMAPALHAHDGVESSMMPGSETGIDGSGYRRAYVLKNKGEKAKKTKKNDPTYRLKQHVLQGVPVKRLNSLRDKREAEQKMPAGQMVSGAVHDGY